MTILEKEQYDEIIDLKDNNLTLKDKNLSLEGKNFDLQDQIRLLHNALYGKKSERIIADGKQPELGLDIEAVSSEAVETERIEYERKKKRQGLKLNRLSWPEDLEVVEVEVGDMQAGKGCADTGEQLVFIRAEITDKLALRPEQYFIRREKRGVYANINSPQRAIYTEPAPDLPIRNCRVDVSVHASILIDKFVYYMTCYRLEEKFNSAGVSIQRQTMYGWIRQIGEALELLYQEIFKRIIQSERMFTDATGLKYLTKGEGSKSGFVYVYIGGESEGKDPPYICYQFAESKHHYHTDKILNEFKGILHSDCEQRYENEAKRDDVTWQLCLAHARRRFFESGHPGADAILQLFQNIFMNEREAWKMTAEERLSFRREKQAPLMKTLYQLVTDGVENAPLVPSAKYKDALMYMYKRKPHFENFLHDPSIVIDNNISERAMKNLVIGRKNWLFLGNKDSGKSTMILLSIIQTARKAGVNLQDYLEDVLRRIMSHPANRIHELLPDEWAKIRNEKNTQN